MGRTSRSQRRKKVIERRDAGEFDTSSKKSVAGKHVLNAAKEMGPASPKGKAAKEPHYQGAQAGGAGARVARVSEDIGKKRPRSEGAEEIVARAPQAPLVVDELVATIENHDGFFSRLLDMIPEHLVLPAKEVAEASYASKYMKV